MGRFKYENEQTLLDYYQEIANTGFGDMLHDWERSKKYYLALEIEINKLKQNGQTVNVLDIGTGTGLLAMFAVKLGADTVTAVERFRPMADCAADIFKRNGMQTKINLIKKSSFDVEIGVDMRQRANLLVAELLDTELIGEGCLHIYEHAHAHLLVENAVCIPYKARVYATLVESPLYAQWNRFKSIANDDGDILLKPPAQIAECPGLRTMHDVHMANVPLHLLKFLTNPLEIMQFDFTSKTLVPKQPKQKNICLQQIANGRADMICFWWDIIMESSGTLILSCAPVWPQQTKDAQLTIPWREHWLQAFYYLPKPMNILTSNTSSCILNCCYDAYSWWFNIQSPLHNKEVAAVPAPDCVCNFHRMFSRTRIGQMNNAKYMKKYLRFIEGYIANEEAANVLVLGDGCVLGLLFAKHGAKKVYCYEPRSMSFDFMKNMVITNDLKNVEIIQNLDDISTLQHITHIFAEPFYSDASLPWDNLKIIKLLKQLYGRISPNVRIAPYSAIIYALPMNFTNLPHLHNPIKEIEGLDLTAFDEMVEVNTYVCNYSKNDIAINSVNDL